MMTLPNAHSLQTVTYLVVMLITTVISLDSQIHRVNANSTFTNNLKHFSNFNSRSDSPKYYNLNALLYKQTTTTTSSQANGANPKSIDSEEGDKDSTPIRPRDETLTNPTANSASSGDDDDDDGGASIEELIRSMRRRSKAGGNDATRDADGGDERRATTEGNDREKVEGRQPVSRTNQADEPSSIDDEREATIQRKQTDFSELPNDVDDDANSAAAADGDDRRGSSNRSDGAPASRLRAGAKVQPHRRDRRASSRKAPPKLKSRRVSRYSRRRKLRHGIKPKRRA